MLGGSNASNASMRQWIKVWDSNGIGIDSGTGTMDRAITPASYSEIMLVAHAKIDNAGYVSTILPLYGFSPSTTRNNYDWSATSPAWQVVGIVGNDGTSTGSSMHVHFTSQTTFSILGNSNMRLYAIYVRPKVSDENTAPNAMEWKTLWSNNAGIQNKDTQTLSDSILNYHEIMVISKSVSSNIGFSSQVITTLGLAPSTTYSNSSWSSWNVCSFATEDGNSNNYAITIQFLSNTTFKIAYYWNSKLYAILAR